MLYCRTILKTSALAKYVILVQNKGFSIIIIGPGSLLRGYNTCNYKNVKMGRGHLKIFFSTTTGPILTRLGINHPWGEGIQVCSNEGDCPSPRGDDSETVKIQ
jgi:hypothetical protein